MSKVIAITGASAGIGRAAAMRLAKDGHALAICARRKERLEEAAAEASRLGGRTLSIAADVTSEAEMNGFVGSAVETFGRLDVVVCNAGFGAYGAIDTIEPAQMRRLIDVNYMGTYHVIRAALPVFRRQNSGHVIVVSSIVGKRGVPYVGAYAATKFAQVGMAECLRAELCGSPIHVSVVCPISTKTEFFDIVLRESGSITRAAGPQQSAEQVADAIARTIDRPAPEVYPYRPSRALVVLNAVAPGLCDRIVKRWQRKPIR